MSGFLVIPSPPISQSPFALARIIINKYAICLFDILVKPKSTNVTTKALTHRANLFTMVTIPAFHAFATRRLRKPRRVEE